MNSLLRISSVTGKEFKHLARDRLTLGLIVMLPLIQLLLFGYAINTMVRDIPIGVVDQSNSAIGRVITEQIRVTQVVAITAHYDTPSQAREAIIAGDIRAALILPTDLAHRVANGNTVGQWLVDGSDTMVGGAILGLRQMPLKLEAGAPPGAYSEVAPSFEVALFFNPERRSQVNIVPGLTAVILTMTMILFTSVALVREREQGNMEMLITTPIHPLELMVGKLVPYVFVGILQMGIIIGLGWSVFDVAFYGNYFNLSVITLAFIAASLTFGLLISTQAKTQMQAMQMTVFVLLPSILLSGFMFPYDAMPVAAQYIAEALPATHFVRLIRGVYLRDAGLGQLAPDIIWLLGFTVVMLTVATLRFQKTLD